MPSLESIQLDDGCWKILKGLSYSPKTPQMLSRIYSMPIAECWKRIHFMEGLGLIRAILMFVSRDGRVLQFYETGDERLHVVVGDTPEGFFETAV